MVPSTSPGVPLAHYLANGDSLRLTCRDCMLFRDLPLEPVIARLEARSVGGGHTGVIEVAGLVRAPCPRCGGRRFNSAPAFNGRPVAADCLPPESAGQ